MRAWLRVHHAIASELLVGYHKVHAVRAGRRSLTWQESVAEALCYGWIDGIRRTVDGDRYTVRFTPRRKGSSWSAINIRLMAELEASGRMTAAGRAAFLARKDPASNGYSAQRKTAELSPALVRRFRTDKGAWSFFTAQPPGYRRMASWWVMQAKRDETRLRRLAILMATSAKGSRLR